ncbi:DUF3040 domain-containing protein [Flexivirga oryzae]|uniref:DUF3040 domain-containing protein n=1 Tax=Flexivirga oryzae TaxID=1794944 RepID=A0A839N759_9MICO|nr:DUF3040 domain-containing protein [Flexivirga oryzae]MBB2893107.1 hypothetical protein [Flexivirga oryzae]
MGLTPHEERQIHEIEESLLESDPGFAERMHRLLRPHRKLVVAGLCLLVLVVVLVVSRPENPTVTVAGTAAAAFLAGWCLGQVRSADPRVVIRRTRAVALRAGRTGLRPVRWVSRRLSRRL